MCIVEVMKQYFSGIAFEQSMSVKEKCQRKAESSILNGRFFLHQ